MTTPREEELRQRELELKERELEIRLRELDADVQKSATKQPEVQEPADYAHAELEDARPGRSIRRRWRKMITIGKFLVLAVVSVAVVSVAFKLGLIIIFGALAYTAFQIFVAKDRD